MLEIDQQKFVPVKHFWTIKITLAIFMLIASVMIGFSFGYFQAKRDILIASEFGRQETVNQYPVISLVQSGITFCYDQGNIYTARVIPTKRSRMPLFKTVRTKK